MQSVKNIAEIADFFNCRVDIASLKKFGSGHINNTYFLKNTDADGPDYLLQQINHRVFTDVEKLTANMCRVIDHLKSKVAARESGCAEKEVMTLIEGRDGKYFYQDNRGSYWRMCIFMRDTKTYDLVETTKQAFEGGKAFGRFQNMLSDMRAETLYEVIPNFHNIESRLSALLQAVEDDPLKRVSAVRAQLDYIDGHAEEMRYFQRPQQQSALPKRVTHNDTKFNNVLLNEHDEAQCVIDLDTVMCGYVAYDFGDAIRTIVNTRAEDEEDPEKIGLNIPLFKAYTKGYLQEAGGFLIDAEVRSLIMGVLLLPYMQAVRFLTDHISGDTYFKIKFEGHNLQRTKAQLRLFELLYEQKKELDRIVAAEMSNYRKEF